MDISKTIKILLLDGSPHGLRTAEVGNHVVRVLVVPRTRIKEALERAELSGIGMYLLIGEEGGDDTRVYVGEAENVYKRLIQHNNDESKDFWNVALCFVSTNNSITKAHVKFLEGYIYKILKSVGRVVVENGSNPASAALPEIDKADAMNFYSDLTLLVGVLGYPFFQEKRHTKETRKTYYCKGPSADAKGIYTDEGFVVLEGSIARIQPADSAKDRYMKLRPNMIESGVIVEHTIDSYIFKKDYIFNSPSAAAQNVLARNANGWTEWKDEHGVTLDQNLRK